MKDDTPSTRAAERWERWERVPSQFEILAAIMADDLRTFVLFNVKVLPAKIGCKTKITFILKYLTAK